MIPSRVTRVLVDTRIPWMLMQSTLSRLPEEKGHRVRAMGVFECDGAHFQRDCNARKSTGKQASGKGKQSKSWSKSEFSFSGKGKSKEKNGKIQRKIQRKQKCEPRCQRLAQGQNIEKLVSQVLKTRNQMQARTFRNLHRHTPWTLLATMGGIVTNGTMAGVLRNGMLTGVPLDGTKVGKNRVTLPQAHFHMEVWMSAPPVVEAV